MKNTVKFTFDKVRFDTDNEVHLVIGLEAPKTNYEEDRAPICVFPVIDVSGSMAGDKLDYAKQSAIKLVDHLSSTDYAGFAVFDSAVKLVFKPQLMTESNKAQLKNKIGDLRAGSCTNFSGGMLLGLEQLNQADVPLETILRVIMLTDGHANEGVATKHSDLMQLLKANLGKVTLSSFGYGDGADQELLADLAKTGKGNYAFIENPDKALNSFAKELGGLLSTYAQDLEIEIIAKNGHEILEVVSDVDSKGDNKKVTISVPEILSEEKRNLVLKVKLAKQSKALPRLLNAFDVQVSYKSLNQVKKLQKFSETLRAKVKFVKTGQEQTKADFELDKIVAQAELVKAQIAAEEKVKKGDYSGAAGIWEVISKDLSFRGLSAYEIQANNLKSKMTDQATYVSNSTYFTSYKSFMTRGVGTAAVSADVQNDINELGLINETSTQTTLQNSFKNNK